MFDSFTTGIGYRVDPGNVCIIL